jgi:hypothetical protein
MITLLKEIRHNPLLWLLSFVPVVFIAAKVWPEAHTPLFVLSIFAIVPLAALLSHATESVAAKTGDAVGGLLNDGSPVLAGRRGDDAHIGTHRFASYQQRQVSVVCRRARAHGLPDLRTDALSPAAKRPMIDCPKVPWRLAVTFGSLHQ